MTQKGLQTIKGETTESVFMNTKVEGREFKAPDVKEIKTSFGTRLQFLEIVHEGTNPSLEPVNYVIWHGGVHQAASSTDMAYGIKHPAEDQKFERTIRFIIMNAPGVAGSEDLPGGPNPFRAVLSRLYHLGRGGKASAKGTKSMDALCRITDDAIRYVEGITNKDGEVVDKEKDARYDYSNTIVSGWSMGGLITKRYMERAYDMTQKYLKTGEGTPHEMLGAVSIAGAIGARLIDPIEMMMNMFVHCATGAMILPLTIVTKRTAFKLFYNSRIEKDFFKGRIAPALRGREKTVKFSDAMKLSKLDKIARYPTLDVCSTKDHTMYWRVVSAASKKMASMEPNVPHVLLKLKHQSHAMLTQYNILQQLPNEYNYGIAGENALEFIKTCLQFREHRALLRAEGKDVYAKRKAGLIAHILRRNAAA